MAERAIFLYSEGQIHEYIPGTGEEAKAKLLDSIVRKRLSNLKSRQHKPAKWVDAVRPEGKPATYIRLNVIPEPATREQLLACLSDGLDKSKFGGKAITVALKIPDKDITETRDARRAASVAIHDVLWAGDLSASPPSSEAASSEQNQFVINIDWSSPRTHTKS